MHLEPQVNCLISKASESKDSEQLPNHFLFSNKDLSICLLEFHIIFPA